MLLNINLQLDILNASFIKFKRFIHIYLDGWIHIHQTFMHRIVLDIVQFVDCSLLMSKDKLKKGGILLGGQREDKSKLKKYGEKNLCLCHFIVNLVAVAKEQI